MTALSHRHGVRRRLSVVLHRQAAARKSDRAQARDSGRGALLSLFPQSLGAARRHQPRGIPRHQVRLGRALQHQRQAGRRAGRRRRPHLRVRQDQAAAEHARLPPADPVGGRHRQFGAHEAAADGPLLHRGRRPHRPRGACSGGGRLRAQCRRACANCWRATRTWRASSRRRTPPRKPASTACPASSSAARWPCRARNRRNTSRRRSSAPRRNIANRQAAE